MAGDDNPGTLRLQPLFHPKMRGLKPLFAEPSGSTPSNASFTARQRCPYNRKFMILQDSQRS
jgi:hypothetical protein